MTGVLAFTAATTAALAEPKTNLLSQWSEGSDAAAIAKLGEMFTAAGGKWEQTSIAGHTANTLAKLRADVVAGNAPPAVQLKGPEIAEWNETGKTANLDAMASEEGWDKVVAPDLLPVMKPSGHWVAAPMNIHRINWIWGSTKAMEQAGIKGLPKTWAEFNADCDKAVAAHLICIAHFSQDWTDATTFEVIVYGMNQGLFKKAFVEGDTAAMRSPEMIKAFEQYRQMVSKYMDPGIAGRDYDSATAMIAKGQAVFMIMGDWQIGIFTAAGTQGRGRTTNAARRRRTGASPASSSIRIPSPSSRRPTRTTSRGRNCSPISSCRRNSRPYSIRPRARSPLGSMSILRISILASSSRRRTCRPRSPTACWCARWPTT